MFRVVVGIEYSFGISELTNLPLPLDSVVRMLCHLKQTYHLSIDHV